VRIVNGGLRLEARAGSRALLVLKSVSGEEIAIERSSDQLAELRSAIDGLLAPVPESTALVAAPLALPAPEPEPVSAMDDGPAPASES
jgi:hypothetical protein